MKWIAPMLAYLAVGLGLFQFHSAWCTLVGFHVAILFSLLVVRPEIPIAVLLKTTNPKWVTLSVLLCGSSGVALFFLWGYFGIANDLPAQAASLGLNAQAWVLFIAYFALVNPFLEEYFWRGYLGHPSRRIRLHDLVYAGYHALVLIGRVHFGSIIFALVMLTFAGWFWRQVAREDQGLLVPVLGHMAADFTILVTIFKMTAT